MFWTMVSWAKLDVSWILSGKKNTKSNSRSITSTRKTRRRAATATKKKPYCVNAKLSKQCGWFHSSVCVSVCLCVCMLLLLLCRIKFDEFFKRYFFNYQINAAEYFSKCVAQAKNAKKKNAKRYSKSKQQRARIENDRKENKMKKNYMHSIYVYYVYYFLLFLFAKIHTRIYLTKKKNERKK